jgi:hypothetical protein
MTASFVGSNPGWAVRTFSAVQLIGSALSLGFEK